MWVRHVRGASRPALPGVSCIAALVHTAAAFPAIVSDALLLIPLAIAALLLVAVPAGAWIDLASVPGEGADRASDDHGIHILDGSCVMNVGELQINITNHGLIGSQYTAQSTLSNAPSGQWPAGSGNEYLWAAGLWVGAAGGEKRVTTGQFERELRPLNDAASTIYEARANLVTRPPGLSGAHAVRLPYTGFDDEEILDGRDDDGDGLVDEDAAQFGDQMMVCTMYDNTRLAAEIYPDHAPLDIKVVQTAFAWNAPEYRNFVGFSYAITNVGGTALTDVYVGMFVDCDIGPHERSDNAKDDMAGYFSGVAQSANGNWPQINVAYMYDGNPVDPLPGYFGVMFMGMRGAADVRAYRRFATLQPYELNGEPINDEQRYTAMSTPRRDANTLPGQENDYRYLVSVGPWASIAAGQTIEVDLAMIVGRGLAGLLTNCANAAAAWQGIYMDLDNNRDTGVHGRETRLCYPRLPAPGSDIWLHDFRFWDNSCVSPFFRTWPITHDSFTFQPDGSVCIWVDMDNCQECDRLAGQRCTPDNRLFERYWTCDQDNSTHPPQSLIGCTGVWGAEGRVPWLADRYAPPPPGMRVVPGSREVQVYWNDDSEHAVDPLLSVVDFESYRVWRSDNWDRPLGTSVANGPASESWSLIAEYDVVDDYVRELPLANGQVRRDTLQLGENTGLSAIAYRPVCLDDARFTGLAAEMQEIVDADVTGSHATRPPLRDFDGRPIPGLEGLLRWETYPAVLDTFYMVTERPANPSAQVVGKRGCRFYQHTDRDVFNGFLYFYSVTATDHSLVWTNGTPTISGQGLAGSPASSFRHAMPGTPAQTVEDRERLGVNTYVYPNPATNASLAAFQQMHPNGDDPTGEHIMFANLPRSQNRIRIYTVDGDLVEELYHDGTTRVGEASWNLISRYGQKIVSGIYMYVVEPSDTRFRRFTSKFVVIR